MNRFDAVIAAALVAAHGVEQVTGLVEDVHARIARPSWRRRGEVARTGGISSLVYRGIRLVTRGTSGVLRLLGGRGRSLALTGTRRETAVREIDGHGSQVCQGGHGQALARDLMYTPVYLHYNTGLHISRNGRELAALLEVLVGAWPAPVQQLAIVGHSMGGLVARSACHYAAQAGHGWPAKLRKLVFLGTPHHGSPLERHGNAFETVLSSIPYAAPFARLGRLRGAGITDLRYGNLLDEDWRGSNRFERTGDTRGIVPLPDGVECYTIAATEGREPDGLGARACGDGLVQVRSALGEHEDPRRALAFPASHRWVASGTGHFALLHRPDVYERLRGWLAD